MLMKIGDVVSKFGISHRSLHYWENAGILQSFRGENVMMKKIYGE